MCLFPDMSDLATVTHALVTSFLNYYNLLYLGLSLKSVWKVLVIQNAAARVLTGTDCREHTVPLLQLLR